MQGNPIFRSRKICCAQSEGHNLQIRRCCPQLEVVHLTFSALIFQGRLVPQLERRHNPLHCFQRNQGLEIGFPAYSKLCRFLSLQPMNLDVVWEARDQQLGRGGLSQFGDGPRR